jgi:hypothetical protein
VAVETPRGPSEGRAVRLQDALTQQLRNMAIAVWPVNFADLCRQSSLPPVRTRHVLRQIAGTIFPALGGNSSGKLDCDAALLGLHVQIERLLSVISPEWSNIQPGQATRLRQN